MNQDFRQLLIAEFESRRKKNPRYSLRSFAKFLGINAACLSVIIKGQRPLTKKMANRFAKALALSPEVVEKYLSSEEEASAQDYATYPIEVFSMMSNWYYDALLELTSLEGFQPDPKWIASRLGISATEAAIAIERLEKYDFINVNEDGSWEILRRHNDLELKDYTTAALRNLQAEILDMSKEALHQVDPQERHHASMTMAISKADLPKAKKLLRRFKQEFTDLMQSSDADYDAVYLLNLGFFSVTEKESGGKK